MTAEQKEQIRQAMSLIGKQPKTMTKAAIAQRKKAAKKKRVRKKSSVVSTDNT